MKTQLDHKRTLTIAGISAMVLLLTVLFFSNLGLKGKLNAAKLQSEASLSDKQAVQKNLNELKAELLSVRGKNIYLDNVVRQLTDNLALKEKSIKRLLTENATVKQIQQENSELQTLRDQLNRQVIDLNRQVAGLQSENSQLSKSLADMQTANNDLTVKNTLLQAMIANNYRVEAVKGRNDRLTVVARKTNKLAFSFDLPTGVSKGLYFTIVTPDAQEISSKDNKSATISITDNPENYTSATDNKVLPVNTQRIEMAFKPVKKLQKGIY